MAIAFADCLVAVGIKAYPVALLSYKDKENGSFGAHLMTHVYISELNKWCLFDPSFNVYFCDSNGRLLNVFELRKLFLDGQYPIVEGYSFNGEDLHKDIYRPIEEYIREQPPQLIAQRDRSIDKRGCQRHSNSGCNGDNQREDHRAIEEHKEHTLLVGYGRSTLQNMRRATTH